MNKGRFIGTLLATGIAATGMASMTLSSPAVAAPGGPRPVTNWLQPVEAHNPSWVSINWQTSSRICDVQVRVDGGRQVDVSYPGPRPFTSLSRGTSLEAFRTDVSTIRVTADADRGGVARLLTTIRYDDCGWHTRPQTRTFALSLPVRPSSHNGPGDNHGGDNHGGNQHGGNRHGGNQHGGNQHGGNRHSHV